MTPKSHTLKHENFCPCFFSRPSAAPIIHSPGISPSCSMPVPKDAFSQILSILSQTKPQGTPKQRDPLRSMSPASPWCTTRPSSRSTGSGKVSEPHYPPPQNATPSLFPGMFSPPSGLLALHIMFLFFSKSKPGESGSPSISFTQTHHLCPRSLYLPSLARNHLPAASSKQATDARCRGRDSQAHEMRSYVGF